jgi:hypothetical protein
MWDNLGFHAPLSITLPPFFSEHNDLTTFLPKVKKYSERKSLNHRVHRGHRELGQGFSQNLCGEKAVSFAICFR